MNLTLLIIRGSKYSHVLFQNIRMKCSRGMICQMLLMVMIFTAIRCSSADPGDENLCPSECHCKGCVIDCKSRHLHSIPIFPPGACSINLSKNLISMIQVLPKYIHLFFGIHLTQNIFLHKSIYTSPVNPRESLDKPSTPNVYPSFLKIAHGQSTEYAHNYIYL